MGSSLTKRASRPQRTPAGEEVVFAEGLAKRFDKRPVLVDVGLSVRKGETLAIIGGSGSGKTTCLRILMRQETPDEGRVFLFGKDLSTLPRAEMDGLRRRFGVVFQSGALLNSLTVGENIALPLRELTELDETIISIVVKMKLEQVGLRDFEDLMPAQLSGGMKKRVAIARALALDPEVLFYDEPTAGLDPVMTAVITELIAAFGKSLGVASVVVTHKMELAYRVASRMILLHEGRIVASGHPDEIRESTDPLVHQFVHGEADGPIASGQSAVDLMDDLLGS